MIHLTIILGTLIVFAVIISLAKKDADVKVIYHKDYGWGKVTRKHGKVSITY